ncbi:MAG: nitroreductase family protein [Lachnospiraceae bacterium]
MDYYNMIFKRKSFHLFRNRETISNEDLSELKVFAEDVIPLDKEIQYKIKIVPEAETTCSRGAEYCIEFYSEEKGNYLRNIGYIGEQIDLWLADRNIGALWFGIGKPDKQYEDGMKFVIMIAIAKMPENIFRKNLFKAKRKMPDEIWQGDTLSVAEIVRFAPSACNTQPWIVKNSGEEITVYRYKKPGKRGIMPSDKVSYYNRIDIGIFLLFLEICLEHEGYSYKRTQFYEDAPDEVERIMVAKYEII